MPKVKEKGEKASRKGRRKQQPTRSTSPRKERHPHGESDSISEPPSEAGLGDDGGGGDIAASLLDREEVDSLALEEKIAEFFEERPYFYDQANELYKNKQMKEAEIGVFATSIGWTAKQVLTRFTSNRTDHGKLMNPKLSKSGQAARRLTVKQKFKLEHYRFLDAHMKPKGEFEELGKFSRPQSQSQSVDVEEEEEEEEGSPVVEEGGSRTSSGSRGARRKILKKRKPVTADVLTQILQETRDKEEEVSKKMDAALAEDPSNERVAWGKWLASTAQTVPSSAWRNYQREMFVVALRYLPPPPLLGQAPPPTELQPPRQLQPQFHPLQTQLQAQFQTLQPLRPQHQPQLQPLQPQNRPQMDWSQGQLTLPTRRVIAPGDVNALPRCQSAPAPAAQWGLGSEIISQAYVSASDLNLQSVTNIQTPPSVIAPGYRTSLHMGDSMASPETSAVGRPRDSSDLEL